jgi:hypothetical protein
MPCKEYTESLNQQNLYETNVGKYEEKRIPKSTHFSVTSHLPPQQLHTAERLLCLSASHSPSSSSQTDQMHLTSSKHFSTTISGSLAATVQFSTLTILFPTPQSSPILSAKKKKDLQCVAVFKTGLHRLPT